VRSVILSVLQRNTSASRRDAHARCRGGEVLGAIGRGEAPPMRVGVAGLPAAEEDSSSFEAAVFSRSLLPLP
jgi:hypothetical protein